MTSTIDRSRFEVPVPAGAEYVTAWQYDLPLPSRQFFGMARGVTGRTIAVGTAGHQLADGSIDSGDAIEIVGNLGGLNSAQARELAAALLQAADEVDEWLAG